MSDALRELSEMMQREHVKGVAAEMLQPNALAEHLKRWSPARIITRWQRIKRRAANYRRRIVMAWRVLRGEEIE